MQETHFDPAQAACVTGAWRSAGACCESGAINPLLIRVGLILLWGASALTLTASPNATAQQLTAIYPRHAVARTETLFTVEGVGLPTADSAQAGLKLSTIPAGSCQNARRYKAATADRYYFACTFEPSQVPVRLRIHNKLGGQSDFLGSFSIPVLAGPPLLAHLTISGNMASSNARVRCEIGAACVTLAGDMSGSDIISVEVKGSNLPPELYFEVEGCLQVSASPVDLREDVREAVCTVAPSAGARKIRILSASPLRGGTELWKTDLNTAMP